MSDPPVGPQLTEVASGNLPQSLIDEMQGIFGKFIGFRTTHAKGLLVEGTFTPFEAARTLSTAAHFNQASTPVIARFSVGGGIPIILDTDNQATPKGVAIRFKINETTHTDLISHTFNGFATKTGEGFLAFLKHVRATKDAGAALATAKAKGGNSSKEQSDFDQAQTAFGAFLGANKSAAVFVKAPKPNPINYGTVTYYEPNTHVLTNSASKVTNIRYRLDPQDGDQLYNDADKLKTLGRDYLEDDLIARFPQKPIVFTIQAHIADPTDVLDDATVLYKSTKFVPIGKVVFNKVAADNSAKQNEISFSPSPDRGGITGIAPSADPLINTRKGVYFISSDQRRNNK